MQESAKARAQAAQMLDEVAAALKRQMRASKEALQAVRQAQAAITGINLITENPVMEDHSVSSIVSEAAELRVVAELHARD